MKAVWGRPRKTRNIIRAESQNRGGKRISEKEMAALGCRACPSQSNFIYFDTGKDPAWIRGTADGKAGIRIGVLR